MIKSDKIRWLMGIGNPNINTAIDICKNHEVTESYMWYDQYRFSQYKQVHMQATTVTNMRSWWMYTTEKKIKTPNHKNQMNVKDVAITMWREYV